MSEFFQVKSTAHLFVYNYFNNFILNVELQQFLVFALHEARKKKLAY